MTGAKHLRSVMVTATATQAMVAVAARAMVAAAARAMVAATVASGGTATLVAAAVEMADKGALVGLGVDSAASAAVE